MASLASFARCGRAAVGAGGCADTRPARPTVEIQARAGATLRKLTTIAWLPVTTMRRGLNAILPQRLIRFNRELSANAELPQAAAIDFARLFPTLARRTLHCCRWFLHQYEAASL